MDFPVEWCNLEHTPLIQLHSFTNRSLPLISLFLSIGSEVPIAKKSSFPSGEAEGKKPYAFTIHPTAQFRGLRADSIRPYSLGGEAAAIHRTAQLRTLREAKSLPYRLRSFRFISVSLPGGSGNQRIGTSPVRHYPAALPPPYVFPSGRRGLDLFFSHSQGIMHW